MKAKGGRIASSFIPHPSSFEYGVWAMQNGPLLKVKGLKTYFFLDEGTVKAVDGADFSIQPGSTVGIVGESGCGKSVTAFSILQLVDRPGRIVAGQILWSRQAQGSGATEITDLAQLYPQ